MPLCKNGQWRRRLFVFLCFVSARRGVSTTTSSVDTKDSVHTYVSTYKLTSYKFDENFFFGRGDRPCAPLPAKKCVGEAIRGVYLRTGANSSVAVLGIKAGKERKEGRKKM